MANDDYLYEAAEAGHLLCQRLIIEENVALTDERAPWEDEEGGEDSFGQGTEEYNRGF